MYVLKHEEFKEFGTRPKFDEGKEFARDEASRPQHVNLRTITDECTTLKEAAEKFPDYFIRFHSGITKWYTMMARTTTERDREVHWYFGATGTGKTREARRLLNERYGTEWDSCKFTPAGFIIGYHQGVEGVLFDDFRHTHCKFEELLTITDRYATCVNVKCGEAIWDPKTIIITCPRHPEVEFTYWRNSEDKQSVTHEDIKQLLRRLTVVRNFGTGPAEQEYLARREITDPFMNLRHDDLE